MGYTKARLKQDRIWQLQGLVLATAVLVAERVPKKTRPTLSCILYIFRRQLLVLQFTVMAVWWLSRQPCAQAGNCVITAIANLHVHQTFESDNHADDLNRP